MERRARSSRAARSSRRIANSARGSRWTTAAMLVLDRDTEIELDPSPSTRVVHVKHGVVAADVAHIAKVAPAKILTEKGEVARHRNRAHGDRDGRHDRRASDARLGAREGCRAGKTSTWRPDKRRSSPRTASTSGPSRRALASASGDLLGERKRDEGRIERRRRRAARASPGRTRRERPTLRIAEPRREGAHRGQRRAHRDRRDVLERHRRRARGHLPLPAAAGRADRAARARGRRQARRRRVRRQGRSAARFWRGAIQNATPQRRSRRRSIVWVPGPVARSGAARVAARRALRAADLPDPEARLAARRPRLHGDRRAVARRAALRLSASERAASVAHR